MPIIANVDTRSAEVQVAAYKFELNDQANPDARQIAMSCARLADEMIHRITGNDFLLIEGLELLLQARGKFTEAKVGRS